jgi:hypothetical protein
MIRMTPLQKQSKREQKEYHAKQRGSWNGLCPVTRTVPNGKGYDRNRDKRCLIERELIDKKLY